MTAARPGGPATTVLTAVSDQLGAPVTRDGAREEARRELSRQVYRDAGPGWFTRALNWFNERLSDLWDWITPDPDVGVAGFRGLGVLALVLVLVTLLVVVRLWLGPVRRSSSGRPEGGDLSSPLTADQLRALGNAQAERGDLADAVRTRLRAVARMLEERTLIDPRPGRTAGELVSDLRAATAGGAAGGVAPRVTAGGTFGDPAGALSAAVEVFSEIWYGGRPATRHDYEVVVRADEELARIRRAQNQGQDRSDDGYRAVPA
ncbi:DUF4129 domain-containing protein [Parafrankia elaeagni]|uniref:DUF4129 domain-containing protein n=1 Tax=Parafrankia elaeagni TaxID=222534 RepID=UPI00037267D3|nr:DUF4129 domain-containing protein [Parafrankia elaeagni]